MHQAGALRDRPPEHHRVSRRVSRPHDGVAGADRRARRCSGAASGRCMPGVYHAPYPDCYRCPARLDAGDLRAPNASTSSRTSSSCSSSRPTKSRRSSSSRSRAKAATSWRPIEFLQRLRELTTQARDPAGRRRSAVGHGPHREDVRDRAHRRRAGHRWRSRRASRRGCRSASRSARADLMTWPPGAHASTFGGNRCRARRRSRRSKLLKEQLVANAAEVGGHLMAGLKALAGQASADRRRARTRPDDRRRAGARSPDEGARRPTSATPSSRRVRARAADARRGEERDPLLAAARADARAGGHRGRGSSTRRLTEVERSRR